MTGETSRLIGIGDCVVDIFRERATAYPGGNAFNVAAYWQIFGGAPADFIGIVGDDVYGDHVVATLETLGIGTTRVRRAYGQTGRTLVDVTEDGDRVFVASNGGGVQQGLSLRLARQDLDAIAGAAIAHTSIYSGLDHQLAALAAAAPVSYDFSDLPPIQSVLPVMPHIQVAFFSAGSLTPRERSAYAGRCIEAGAMAVVMTAGSRGSDGFVAGSRHHEGITPVEVVDALGAGDGFIAGFLSEWIRSRDLPRAMRTGSRTGARSCTLPGAFGHGLPATEGDMNALIRRGLAGPA